MTPADFWRSTPREVWIFLEGARWRSKQAYGLAVTTGWLSAMLERQKRIPEIQRLIEPRRRQAPEQLLERLKQWHVALGGDPRDLEKLQQKAPS